jgi:peptide/nickel transport system permease protein
MINRRLEQQVGDLPEGPIYVRYFKYLWNVFIHQDFGVSLWRSKPVFVILFKAMPWSVFLSVYGLLFGFSTNIVLGAFMAYKEGSWFDSGTTILVVVLNSIPYYAVALVSLSILAFQFGWFPTGGRVSSETVPGVNWPYIAGVIEHAALPILSSFVVGFGGGALAMRGNSVRILGEDYLRVARLRGLSTQRIATRYVARNAVLPMYTTLMIGISALFSSSVILEQIFTYPGVGWYTYGALLNRDYPLLMGAFIFYTALTVTGILLADLTYGLIDPRVKSGGDRESF